MPRKGRRRRSKEGGGAGKDEAERGTEGGKEGNRQEGEELRRGGVKYIAMANARVCNLNASHIFAHGSSPDPKWRRSTQMSQISDHTHECNMIQSTTTYNRIAVHRKTCINRVEGLNCYIVVRREEVVVAMAVLI